MKKLETKTEAENQKSIDEAKNDEKFVYNTKEFLTLVNDTDDDMEYMSPHKYYDKGDK